MNAVAEDIGYEAAPIGPQMAALWPLSPAANLAERERRIRETPVVLSADEQLVADLESCLRRMPRELPLEAGGIEDAIVGLRHFHGLTDAQVDEARAERAAEVRR